MIFSEEARNELKQIFAEVVDEKLEALLCASAPAATEPLTEKEACELFNVCQKTLYNRRKDGTLSFTRNFRGEICYRRADIERFYDRRAVKAVGEKNNVFSIKAA